MDHVMLAIFALALGGLGVMLIVVGAREFLSQRRMLATAVPVEAVILSAQVTSAASISTDSRPLRSSTTMSHRPCVRFRYTFRGVCYESELLYATVIERGFASREEAAAEIHEYSPRATVRAYADASTPERGFLRLERTSRPACFMGAGLLTLMFLGVVVFLLS